MNGKKDKVSVIVEILKTTARSLMAIKLSAAPGLAVAADEITSRGFDLFAHMITSLTGTSDRVLFDTCKQYLPELEKEYYPIIVCSAKLCLENISLLNTEFDADKIAKDLSDKFLKRYAEQFSSHDYSILQKYLPLVLAGAIKDLLITYESDKDFQIAWKNLMIERLDVIESEQLRQEAVLEDHEQRIAEQENRAAQRSDIANLKEMYLSRWCDTLFLDNDVLLSDIYQVPNYRNDVDDEEEDDGFFGVFTDLKSRLQSVLDLCNNTKRRMLVVLGHPGSGKSTLITYLLNNCTISKDRTIQVYRFSNFDSEKWKNAPDNLPQIILNQLCMDQEDLNNTVLILDGLDEVDMQENQNDFLESVYKQWACSKSILRFSLIITCRTNRIAAPSLLSAPFIILCPLDSWQITAFSQSYYKIKTRDASGGKFHLKIDTEFFRDVIGIPLILYLSLALEIDLSSSKNLADVYDQIFSLKNENSIYTRSRYDKKHEITSREAEKIHSFSKHIALIMWELNPFDATVSQSDYAPIVDKIVGDDAAELSAILIGQYFVEGQHGHELYFVHRSIYEYFVALSLFDVINAIQNLELTPEELFDKHLITTLDSPLTPIANLIGLQLLSEFPDIQELLSHMLQKRSDGDYKWWKLFLDQFIKNGLIDATRERRKGGKIGLEEEANRFFNLIWIVREMAMHSDAAIPFSVSDDLLNAVYFHIKKEGVIDLSKIHLGAIELINVAFENSCFHNSDLSHAKLLNSNFSGSDFRSSKLSHTNFRGSCVSGADFTGADLSHSDLQDADFSNAILRDADLSDANLSGVNLFGADLSGAVLDKVIFSNAGLEGAILAGVKMEGAILSDVNLGGINLNNSIIKASDLTGASLENASLKNADLSLFDFQNANLANADLSGATLERTILHSANMSGAYVKNAKFIDANLAHIMADGADYSGSVFRHANFRSANLNNAVFTDSLFTGGDLRDADLTYANFLNANFKNTKLSDGSLDSAIYNHNDYKKWKISWSDPRDAKLFEMLTRAEVEESDFILSDRYLSLNYNNPYLFLRDESDDFDI